MAKIEVKISFEDGEDQALYNSLTSLKKPDQIEKVKSWSRLGHFVMAMARVAPSPEALSDYLGDFTNQTLNLIQTIEDHTKLFTLKGMVIDGAFGEKFVRECLISSFARAGDSFEIWSETGHQGDLLGKIAVPDKEPLRVLIEVKDYKQRVPTKEVDKFRLDLRAHPEMDAGIFISLRSRISGRTGVIDPDVEDGRTVIYISQEHPAQLMFIVVWGMMRTLFSQHSSRKGFEPTNTTRILARRIRDEVATYVEETNYDISRVEAIQRHVGSIRKSTDSISTEAAHLAANIRARADNFRRFIDGEIELLDAGVVKIGRNLPWSEAEWLNKFEEIGARDKVHRENLKTLHRWLCDFDGITCQWRQKGLVIQINGEDRFSIVVLASGLRLIFPANIVSRAELKCAWEGGKIGQVLLRRSGIRTFNPDVIFAALRNPQVI